jgi:hypothetical protein
VPTIRFTVTTPLAPEAVAQALTDFSPDRPKRWRNLDPTTYRVHDRGDNWAEVTEGASQGGGVWERSRYDWSEPLVITSTLIDSNVLAPGSYWKYELRPASSGGTDITCTVHRVGKGLKGKALVTLIGLIGRRVIQRDLELRLSQLD